ncbi:MAG TPA: YbfB/YjiJ family MFS transporter [Alphaproteobacteria bacterium]|jgi:MFS family permease|nr:YbfB/YjiJ family MFS transporter [Alphaproteobacteria bacterium]
MAAFVALAVAMGIGRFALTPLLPMMKDDAGLSVVAGGWLAAANYAGYLAGAVAAAVVPLSASRAVRAGLVATAVTTAAMGLSHRFEVWLVLRALAGVASALVMVFASAWIAEVLAHHGRRTLSGPTFAGVGVGIAIAGLVCLVMARAGAASATVWLGLAVVSIALGAAAWRPFRATGALSHRDAAAALPLSGADTVRLWLCYGASGIGYIIPATFLPALAKDALQDPGLFQWAWPVFGAAAAGSTLMIAGLQRRLGNVGLWMASHCAMAVGVVLPVVSHSFAAIMAASLLVGGTFVVTTMTALGAAHEIAGPRARTLIATMTAAFAVGQIAGPVALSLLIAAGGAPDVAWIAAAALLVASAALLAPLLPRMQRLRPVMEPGR